MKVIIISIFTLFLFSCLDGQDGLFGTNGKIGCVETSDCEVGYSCNDGKCEKSVDRSCTKHEDCETLQRCNINTKVCEPSFGARCNDVPDCGNSKDGKYFQCDNIVAISTNKVCFFDNCNGVSDAVEYPDFNVCLPGCTENFLCDQVFGENQRVCKVSEGRCVEANNSSFVCNPTTNEGCTGTELCYLYFAGTTARTICGTFNKIVEANDSCNSTDLICESEFGCSSINKCKKLCVAANCTENCTVYGTYNNMEIGLCDSW